MWGLLTLNLKILGYRWSVDDTLGSADHANGSDDARKKRIYWGICEPKYMNPASEGCYFRRPMCEGPRQPWGLPGEGDRRLRAVRKESWGHLWAASEDAPSSLSVGSSFILYYRTLSSHLWSHPPSPTHPPLSICALNFSLSRSLFSEPQVSGTSTFLPWVRRIKG